MAFKKHTIVHLTPRYIPSLGGVETHLRKINEVFLREGFKVRVVTIQHEENLPLHEKIEGVKVLRIPFSYTNNKFKTWSWIWEHKNIFNDAIIHVHDVSWWLVPVLPFIFKKFFITNHGWEGKFPVPFLNKVQRYFFFLCAQKTIHVGEYIRHFYWEKPDAIIYGGVDALKPSRKKSSQNSALKIIRTLVSTGMKAITKILGSKKLQFVFIGRLENENDIEKYLEFLKLFKEQHSFEITWLGDGAFRESCEQFGEVTGMITDLKEYIEPADFVFAASYLSILQAQNQGKIVCSFYSHSLKEKYLQTYPGAESMLIESKPQEMVNQLKSLLADKNKKNELSKTAQIFAQSQTWEKIAAVYKDTWGVSIKR